jgi:hypothetical protein
MSEKYQLMIDPTPAGWAYGFPRALPEEAVMCCGKEYDLYVHPNFDLAKWVVEQGYPEESFQYYRLYPQEVEGMCGGVYEEELKEETTNEKMGDMKFTTAGDFMKDQEGDIDLDKFVYPGSDPQE